MKTLSKFAVIQTTEDPLLLNQVLMWVFLLGQRLDIQQKIPNGT